MTNNEKLEYLNEGKISDKLKNFLNKLKKKNKRNQETATKTQPKKIAKCVTSEKRKEFVKKILEETKSVLPIFNDDICEGSTKVFTVEPLIANEDFWEGVVYEGEEDEYEKNPDANKFYWGDDVNNIWLIFGDDYEIKGAKTLRSPIDIWDHPIYEKRNHNFNRGMNELKKKLSKYGHVDWDGDKNEVYIYLAVSDGVIK